MTDRAVVLAAGRGTRLGELTTETPKPLLDVGGMSVIERILEGIAAAQIYKAAIITGHLADEVEDATWGLAGMSLEFIRQPTQNGTAGALSLARDFTHGQRFFFTWGDILVHSANYEAVIEAASWADAVVAVNHVDDPTHGAAVYVTDDFIVQRIEEKPPPGGSTTNWNNAGFGILGVSIWEQIDDLVPSERGEMELPDAIAGLIESGAKVLAVPVQGSWFDIGTPEILAAARAHYSSR